jgi:hypothetical protein
MLTFTLTAPALQQATASKRKKELERLTTLRDKLLEEEARQCEHQERVIARLTEVRAVVQ